MPDGTAAALTSHGTRSGRAVDVAILFACKAAVSAWVLALGFTHVSDDDYARVVIAETFAHAPKLDPSGTSWLPLPFWIYGGAMAVLGPTLASARAVACVLGVVATAPPYLALRGVGVARAPAVIGVALAMALPWSAWTGVAPIPEALVAGLVAAAAIACARAELAGFAAVCALAASLSRYEAWPVCAIVAGLALARGRKVGVAALALAGPLAWVAWNGWAHSDPLHFIARVTAYRQATGAASITLADKLLGNPAVLFNGAPFIAAVSALALVTLAWRATRARWAWPLACAAVTLAFLVYGDARDGAPTHHPERALLGVWWILTAFATDALFVAAARGLRRVPRGVAIAAGAALAAACLGYSASRWLGFPGRGDEDRAAQVARGYAVRARAPRSLAVTPCAYEHFALLAAFGAPERATVAPATHAPVTALCPRVVER